MHVFNRKHTSQIPAHNRNICYQSKLETSYVAINLEYKEINCDTTQWNESHKYKVE